MDKMGKLFAVVAFGLLAAGSAQGAYVYNLDGTDSDGLPDFVLTVPALITVDTTFALSEFDSISLPSGVTVLSVRFENPLASPLVWFDQTNGAFGYFWTSANAFVGPGQYCAGFIGCGNTDAIMTIRESASVPVPGTLALLGLALAGLGASRRR